jgi:hypothetical protein
VTIPHPRPTELTLLVERRTVPGACPECGTAALQSYPVLAEAGWFDVIKCSNCLRSVSRVRGPRLGPIRLLSDLV